MRALWLCLGLMSCDHAPAPAVAPATPRSAGVANAHAPSPHRWGVSFRRTGWSLLDPPLVSSDVILFDQTRFSWSDGRWVGFEPIQAPVALLSGDRTLTHEDGKLHLYRRGRRVASTPAGIVDAIALSPNGARLALIETRYRAGTPSMRLVVRSAQTLAMERDAILGEGGDSMEGVAWRGDDEVIVPIPQQCRAGRCSARRLERWSGASRHVLARGFDRVALDETGRAALLVAQGEAVVIDTESGAAVWKLGAAAPQAVALAAGGEVAALVEASRDDGLELRILEKEQSASRVVFAQPIDMAADVAFHGSEPTLLVSGLGFTALRRGADKPPPAFPYALRPPASFRRIDGVSGPTDLPKLHFEHRQRGISVFAQALERSELAVADHDRAWAALAFRRVRGVDAAQLSEPQRAFRVWRDARGRHAELIVPACHEGVSNADDYLRVSEVDGAVVIVSVIVEPGTPAVEVAALLKTFFDAPLGPPKTPRALPKLPARDCGI